MPTSTSFTALGGFPFCPTKVDVSDFDKWTTLGGNKKGGSVTETGKGLAEAMKLFWNLNGVSGEMNDDGDITSFLIDMEGEDYDRTSWFDLSDPVERESNVNKTPPERVCYSRFLASDFNEEDFEDPSLNMRAIIIRMYDGDEDDEDNFVGYGVSGGAFDIIHLQSFIDISLISFGYDPGVSGKAQYVEFAGMNFVADIRTLFGGDSSTYLISDSGGSIIATVAAGDDVYATFTISSPSFYTY